VSQRRPRPMVGCAIYGRRVSRSNGRLGTPDCPVCQWAPRINGRLCPIWKEIAHLHEQWLPGGAPDCPGHHSTEGKNGLPSWPPTDPSCLGAIKGAPRRMEENTQHSLSILRHPDSGSTHLIHSVSDLSSLWVVNSLCCALSSSLGLRACVCCGLNLVCVVFPSLTFVFLLWSSL
jgi:hypothetical protein